MTTATKYCDCSEGKRDRGPELDDSIPSPIYFGKARIKICSRGSFPLMPFCPWCGEDVLVKTKTRMVLIDFDRLEGLCMGDIIPDVDPFKEVIVFDEACWDIIERGM